MGYNCGTSPSEIPAPPSLLSVEYISLIVIILAFVVSVFAQQLMGGQGGVRQPATAEVVKTRPIEVVTMKRFFAPNGAGIQRRAVRPWAALIAKHDISVTAEVGVTSTATDGEWALAIARSVSLKRYLAREGVPADAMKIVAVPRKRERIGQMRLHREAL